MELLHPVDSFIPDLKYLLDTVQAPNPVKGNCKKEKKLVDEITNFSEAYLGPQIWSNMMAGEDMKLRLTDLEDLLLDDCSLTKELMDVSLLMTPESTLKNEHTEQSEDGRQYLQNSAPEFNQFCSTTIPYTQPAPPLIPLPQQELNIVLPVCTLSEIEDESTPATPESIVSTVEFEYHQETSEFLSSPPLNENENDSDSEMFDPCKRHFTDEELKPQPIIRKAKKIYVADGNKDEKYWHKREKNNVAAKRSREARRIKENQIAMRTKFLERENNSLHGEVVTLRSELTNLMDIVAKYEARDAAIIAAQ